MVDDRIAREAAGSSCLDAGEPCPRVCVWAREVPGSQAIFGLDGSEPGSRREQRRPLGCPEGLLGAYGCIS